MSLEPKEIKRFKRKAEMGSGTHLVIINDLFYLKNAAGNKLQPHGFDVMVVQFKNNKGLAHEQHYNIDNAIGSANFKKLFAIAGVVSSVEGTKPTKKDAIGKRLWISIKEVHHINDDKVIMEDDKPVIEYYTFKLHPFIEGVKKPVMLGDPTDNDGRPSGVFIEYKNFSIEAQTNLMQPLNHVNIMGANKSESGLKTFKEEYPVIAKSLDDEPQF